MLLLGRLFEKDPPKRPAGSRYIVDRGSSADTYRVKLVLAGQDVGSPDLKPVGREFTNGAKAGEYRDWLMGGALFDYGTGKV